MKLKLTIFVVLLFVSGSLNIVQGQCDDTIRPYVTGDVGERLLRITELHAKGKQAISLLLDEISDSQEAPVKLGNPFLSNRPFESPTYCGSIAAYLIELVLARNNLSLRAFRDYSDSLLQGVPEDYIFPLGYIVDKHSGKPINKRILSQVSRLYKIWWENNANRNIELLRGDWMKGKGPLAGSDYEWR